MGANTESEEGSENNEQQIKRVVRWLDPSTHAAPAPRFARARTGQHQRTRRPGTRLPLVSLPMRAIALFAAAAALCAPAAALSAGATVKGKLEWPGARVTE